MQREPPLIAGRSCKVNDTKIRVNIPFDPFVKFPRILAILPPSPFTRLTKTLINRDRVIERERTGYLLAIVDISRIVIKREALHRPPAIRESISSKQQNATA